MRDSAYARSVAAPAAHVEGSDTAHSAAREVCSVERWRGYVYSTFCARRGDGSTILESPSFRWRGPTAPPDEGAARQAYDGLAADLEALGWERESAPSEPWYAARFARAVLGVEAAPAPELESVPAASPAPRARPASPQALQRPDADLPPARSHGTPQSPPAQTPRTARRMPIRLGAAALGIAVVAGSAAGAAVYISHPAGRQPAKGAASQPAKAPVSQHVQTPAVPAAPKPVAAAAAPTVRVSITAKDRGSWLQVRRRSAHGPILYSGNLSPGERVHFHGTRIWALFGAASNLSIVADGKQVLLSGTFEHVFAAK